MKPFKMPYSPLTIEGLTNAEKSMRDGVIFDYHKNYAIWVELKSAGLNPRDHMHRIWDRAKEENRDAFEIAQEEAALIRKLEGIGGK